jgi:transcriptional regulator with XRE-family HTH domain
MAGYDPEQFWLRFRTLADKDLPVILQTDIKQSTLSTWRTEKTYPRADDAVKIAAALQTTVEYLVTGSDKTLSPLDPASLEITLTAAKLSPEGRKTLLYVAKGLLTQLPKTAE